MNYVPTLTERMFMPPSDKHSPPKHCYVDEHESHGMHMCRQCQEPMTVWYMSGNTVIRWCENDVEPVDDEPLIPMDQLWELLPRIA